MLPDPDTRQMTPVNRAFLSLAVETVDAHLHESDFSVDSFCGLMGFSRSQMYRKISALTGQSPSRFIMERRLERAARMLREEPLSISEIARRTGFRSRSYFTVCFREQYKVVPSRYIKIKKDRT